MACPFFDPEARANADWGPGRYPLGAPHTGTCRAVAAQPALPSSLVLRKYCNFGYAREHCSHFPGNGAPDAVRFGIAGDGGGIIRVHYVVERDHHPFSYAL